MHSNKSRSAVKKIITANILKVAMKIREHA